MRIRGVEIPSFIVVGGASSVLALTVACLYPWPTIIVAFTIGALCIAAIIWPDLRVKIPLEHPTRYAVAAITASVFLGCVAAWRLQVDADARKVAAAERQRRKDEGQKIRLAMDKAQFSLAIGALGAAEETLSQVSGFRNAEGWSNADQLLKGIREAASDEFLKKAALEISDAEYKNLMKTGKVNRQWFGYVDLNKAFCERLTRNRDMVSRLRREEEERKAQLLAEAAERTQQEQERMRREAEQRERDRLAIAAAEEAARNRRLAAEKARRDAEQKRIVQEREQLAKFEAKLSDEARKAILAEIKRKVTVDMNTFFDLANDNGNLAITKAAMGMDNSDVSRQRDQCFAIAESLSKTVLCKDLNQVRISRLAYENWGRSGKRLTARFDFSVGGVAMKDAIAHVFIDDPLQDERYTLKRIEIEHEQ